MSERECGIKIKQQSTAVVGDSESIIDDDDNDEQSNCDDKEHTTTVYSHKQFFIHTWLKQARRTTLPVIDLPLPPFHVYHLGSHRRCPSSNPII